MEPYTVPDDCTGHPHERRTALQMDGPRYCASDSAELFSLFIYQGLALSYGALAVENFRPDYGSSGSPWLGTVNGEGIIYILLQR